MHLVLGPRLVRDDRCTWSSTRTKSAMIDALGPRPSTRLKVPLAGWLPPLPPRSTNHSPRQRAGMLAVAQPLHPVDEDIAHSGRGLVRPVERRVILDRLRVEDDDVGVETRHQPTAIAQL